MRVRFLPGVAILFNNFYSHLIHTIMKEAFKKIEDLAKELNESVKPGVGGGYIIIASGNSADEDANTLCVMNGHGISILDMLTKTFLDSPKMREFAKAAAIAADAMERGIRRRVKKAMTQDTPADAETDMTADDTVGPGPAEE